jgi:hypothetical protein
MTKGSLPIVLTAPEQITADPVAVQAILFNPSASTSSFALYDNSGNVVAEANLTVQTPFYIEFPEPIPTVGLVLKAIAAGTIMIYPVNI